VGTGDDRAWRIAACRLRRCFAPGQRELSRRGIGRAGLGCFRGFLRLFGLFARDHLRHRRIALISGRCRGETALFPQVLAGGRFVVVLRAASELVGGETFGRSIIHPAQARKVRDRRAAGAPLMGMTVVGMVGWRSSVACRRMGRRIGSGSIAARPGVANRECRNHSARRAGASRTRALAVSFGDGREDLESDPARLAITFVNRHLYQRI
jgi:hypothetical protein